MAVLLLSTTIQGTEWSLPPATRPAFKSPTLHLTCSINVVYSVQYSSSICTVQCTVHIGQVVSVGLVGTVTDHETAWSAGNFTRQKCAICMAESVLCISPNMLPVELRTGPGHYTLSWS